MTQAQPDAEPPRRLVAFEHEAREQSRWAVF